MIRQSQGRRHFWSNLAGASVNCCSSFEAPEHSRTTKSVRSVSNVTFEGLDKFHGLSVSRDISGTSAH